MLSSTVNFPELEALFYSHVLVKFQKGRSREPIRTPYLITLQLSRAKVGRIQNLRYKAPLINHCVIEYLSDSIC